MNRSPSKVNRRGLLLVALLWLVIIFLAIAVKNAVAQQAPPTKVARSQTVKLLRGDPAKGKKGVIKIQGASYATKPFCTFHGAVTNCTSTLHYSPQCDDAGKCQPVDPERWVSTTRWTGRYSTVTTIRPVAVPEHSTGLIYPGESSDQ
jgi:hypothetical protein